jgi:hypothetical protein
MPIPRNQATPRELLADQDRYPSDWRPAIPRISHDQRQTAASGGIWLHGPGKEQGRRSVPELRFSLVAGAGFEPA